MMSTASLRETPALNPEKLDGNYRDLVHDAVAALNPSERISGQTIIRVRP
jgi:hypothetical protein